MIHIGRKIKEQVYKLNIPITEFASSIHKSRTVVYNIFERKTIDTGLLYNISQVLDYNFFKLYIKSNLITNENNNSKESAKISKKKSLKRTGNNKPER